MGGRDKEPHQPEPWTQEGRYILDAGQWTLASTKFPADARRIVAAVNAVRGIPTDALESWVINVIGDQGGRRAGERRETPAESVYPNDRRVGDRRRGERRASRPEIQVWAGTPPAPEPADESKGADLGDE
jgi:hypothetical protein